MPLGFIYNGTQYFYITNNAGDVISITDENGAELVMYEYDDWGVLEGAFSVHNEDWELSLAQANPIRYRGYYLDTETGYYYLQSRYYDPSICRFINSDFPEFAQFQKNKYNGINLFSYCYNNPIKDADPSGKFPYYSWLIGFLIDVIITLLNPAVASSFDVVGQALKAYYKSKGKNTQ